MNVGNKDKGTLIRNGFLSGDSRKSSPLLKVQGHVSIGDESVTLAVRCGTNEEPSEHGVASVPLLSMDRGTPSPLGKLWELVVKITGGRIVVERGKVRLDVQRRAVMVPGIENEVSKTALKACKMLNDKQ